MPQTFSCVTKDTVPPTTHTNNTLAGTPDLTYPIGFPYLKTEDILVYTGTTNAWTLRTFGNGADQYKISPAGGLATDEVVFNNGVPGASILIWRKTDICKIYRNFTAGSSIRAEDLNTNFTQLLHVVQENFVKLYGAAGDGNGSEFWNRISSTISAPVQGQTIKSGEPWQPDDNHIATAAAGDARWLQQQGGGGGTLTGGDMINVTGATISVDLAATSGLESTNPGNAAGELRIDVNDGCEIVAAGLNAETTDASIVQTGGNNNDPAIRIRKTLGTATNDDDLQISGGANITVTRNSASELTIAAPAVTGGSTFRGTVDVDNNNTLPATTGQQNPNAVAAGDAFTVENNVAAANVTADWDTVLANWVAADGIINSGDVILCTTGAAAGSPTDARYNLIRTGGNINTLQQVTDAGNTTTNVIEGPNGKEGAPSYTFDGDENTGIFRPAADTVGVAVNAQERFRVETAGIRVLDDAGNALHQINANASAVFNETGANADFRVESTGSQNMLFVDADADHVGIGEAAPSETLDVRGNIQIGDGGSLVLQNALETRAVSINADDATETYKVTLPPTAPTANDQVLQVASGTTDAELKWGSITPGGVTKITAGTNVTISPSSGVGNVTINSIGGGSTKGIVSQDVYGTAKAYCQVDVSAITGTVATPTMDGVLFSRGVTGVAKVATGEFVVYFENGLFDNDEYIVEPSATMDLEAGYLSFVDERKTTKTANQVGISVTNGSAIFQDPDFLSITAYDDKPVVISSGTGTQTTTNIYGTLKAYAHVPVFANLGASGSPSMNGVLGSRGIASMEIAGLGTGVLINFVPGTFSDTNYNFTCVPLYNGESFIAYETTAVPRTKDSLYIQFSTASASLAPAGFDIQVSDNTPAEVSLTTNANVLNFNSAAAWGNIKANEYTIDQGLNCSSVQNGTAIDVTFDTPMPNADYAVTFGGSSYASITPGTKTARGFRFTRLNANGNVGNEFDVDFAVHALNAPPPKGGTGTDAWGTVFRNQAGNDFTIGGTYNIARISYTEKCDGTIQNKQNGIYYVTFTTPMPNNKYSVTCSLAQPTYGVDVTASDYDARGFTLSTVNSQQGVYTVAYSASFSVNATNAQLPNTISQEQLDAIFEGRAYNGVAAWGYVDSTNDITAGSNIKQVTGPTAAGAGIVNAYTVEFDNPMPNSDYAIIANIDNDLGGQAFVTPIPGSRTPTQFQVRLWTSTALAASGDWNFAVHALNAAPPKGGTGTDAWASEVGTAGGFGAGYNIKDITQTGTGIYQVEFISPMPDGNYSVVGEDRDRTVYASSKTSTGFQLNVNSTSDSAGAVQSSGSLCFVVNATNAQLPVTVSQEQIEALARNPMVGAWGDVAGLAGANTPAIIHKSFNIKSVKTNATSITQVDVEFETPMNDANYSVVGTVWNSGTSSNFGVSNKTASGFTYYTNQVSDGNATGPTQRVMFQVIGATRNAAPLGGGADAWGSVTKSLPNTTAAIDTQNTFNCTVSKTVKPDGSVVAAAANTFYVTFTDPMPNAEYAVNTSLVGTWGVTVGIFDKTVQGFKVLHIGDAGGVQTYGYDFDFQVFATDGNAGGFWANNDGTLVPTKASDVTITGTLTCDDVVETGTSFSLKNIGTRLAALESGAISDDAVDSALLTLIAQLSERVTQLENT